MYAHIILASASTASSKLYLVTYTYTWCFYVCAFFWPKLCLFLRFCFCLGLVFPLAFLQICFIRLYLIIHSTSSSLPLPPSESQLSSSSLSLSSSSTSSSPSSSYWDCFFGLAFLLGLCFSSCKFVWTFFLFLQILFGHWTLFLLLRFCLEFAFVFALCLDFVFAPAFLLELCFCFCNFVWTFFLLLQMLFRLCFCSCALLAWALLLLLHFCLGFVPALALVGCFFLLHFLFSTLAFSIQTVLIFPLFLQLKFYLVLFLHFLFELLHF